MQENASHEQPYADVYADLQHLDEQPKQRSLIMLLAVFLLIALLAAAGAFALFRAGFFGGAGQRADGNVPVIQAPAAPAKVKPASPAPAMPATRRRKLIYDRIPSDNTTKNTPAPPASAPKPPATEPVPAPPPLPPPPSLGDDQGKAQPPAESVPKRDDQSEETTRTAASENAKAESGTGSRDAGQETTQVVTNASAGERTSGTAGNKPEERKAEGTNGSHGRPQEQGLAWNTAAAPLQNNPEKAAAAKADNAAAEKLKNTTVHPAGAASTIDATARRQQAARHKPAQRKPDAGQAMRNAIARTVDAATGKTTAGKAATGKTAKASKARSDARKSVSRKPAIVKVIPRRKPKLPKTIARSSSAGRKGKSTQRRVARVAGPIALPGAVPVPDTATPAAATSRQGTKADGNISPANTNNARGAARAFAPAVPPSIVTAPRKHTNFNAGVRVAPPAVASTSVPAANTGNAARSPARRLASATPVARTIARAPAARTNSNTPTGGYVVQLAAYRSQQDAQRAWQRVRSRHGRLLGGMQPIIARKDLGAAGIFYRLSIGPLPSRRAASQLCQRLIARGEPDCLVRKR